jgi:protein-tyrosine phosphatase
MAEVLLRHHLAVAGVAAAVSSAGLYEGGARATRHGISVMAERGLDLLHHRSRKMNEAMIGQADLVIGMAREHVREASVVHNGAMEKTFTLKELVRGAESIGPREVDELLDAWLGRIAALRGPSSLVGVGHDDELDVEDPVGRGLDDYTATAELLDQLLGRVVAFAFPAGARQQERSA